MHIRSHVLRIRSQTFRIRVLESDPVAYLESDSTYLKSDYSYFE